MHSKVTRGERHHLLSIQFDYSPKYIIVYIPLYFFFFLALLSQV